MLFLLLKIGTFECGRVIQTATDCYRFVGSGDNELTELTSITSRSPLANGGPSWKSPAVRGEGSTTCPERHDESPRDDDDDDRSVFDAESVSYCVENAQVGRGVGDCHSFTQV